MRRGGEGIGHRPECVRIPFKRAGRPVYTEVQVVVARQIRKPVCARGQVDWSIYVYRVPAHDGSERISLSQQFARSTIGSAGIINTEDQTAGRLGDIEG